MLALTSLIKPFNDLLNEVSEWLSEWVNECSAFNSNPIKIDVNENDDDGDDRRCDLNSNSSAFLGTSTNEIPQLQMGKPKRNTKCPDDHV